MTWKGIGLVLGAFVVVGCRPPEAPETLDELASFLFEHTWDDDESYLEPGLINLQEWLEDGFAETSKGYEVTNISPEAVASVALEERDLTDLIGAAVGYDVALPADQVVDLMLFEDPVEMFPGDFDKYEREFLSDSDCFRNYECSTLELYVSVVANYPLSITGTSDTHMQYHWVELETGRAAVQRSWTRWEPDISVDWLRVVQQYYLAVTLPKADGTTRRLEAMWLQAEILNADIPESMALNMTIDTMAKTGEQLEAYVANNP